MVTLTIKCSIHTDHLTTSIKMTTLLLFIVTTYYRQFKNLLANMVRSLIILTMFFEWYTCKLKSSLRRLLLTLRGGTTQLYYRYGKTIGLQHSVSLRRVESLIAVQLEGNFTLRLMGRFRSETDFLRTATLNEKLKRIIFICLVISY